MAGTERLLTRSAVFVLLQDAAGRVLLQRRAHTGYMDGRYDLPAGHVERGELLPDAAARELREETGVVVRPADLELWHIGQFDANGQLYYNFIFRAHVWQGEPKVMEADKSDDMQFFALDELPAMTPGTHVALEHIGADKLTFGFIDQAVYDQIALS